MTSGNDSSKDFRPDQAHRHIAVWGKTGSGKSVLIAQELLKGRIEMPAHLEINFKPAPSQ